MIWSNIWLAATSRRELGQVTRATTIGLHAVVTAAAAAAAAAGEQ